jgi:hypothetical protein
MAAQSDSVLRHVVLFAFKADAGDGVQQVEEAFCQLPGLIPQIQSFEWGTDVSVENIQQGFTHCFLLGFAGAKARDEYLVHPDHQAFGRLAQPFFEKVLVIDYWAQNAPAR